MIIEIPQPSQGEDICLIKAVVDVGFRSSENSIEILIGNLHFYQHPNIIVDVTLLNSVGRQTPLSKSRVED